VSEESKGRQIRLELKVCPREAIHKEKRSSLTTENLEAPGRITELEAR